MAKIGEVLDSAAAIAKGMGITFKEMLQPTITEEYPDAPFILNNAHIRSQNRRSWFPLRRTYVRP